MKEMKLIELEGVHDFCFHNDNSLALGFENIFPFDNIQLMEKKFMCICFIVSFSKSLSLTCLEFL